MTQFWRKQLRTTLPAVLQ